MAAKPSVQSAREPPHVQELQQLNQLKNRATDPADADIDSSVTLANLLQPGADDNRFDATRGGVIEVVVVDAKAGGIETGNCRATDALYRDTHIEVAQQSPAAATSRVIVESRLVGGTRCQRRDGLDHAGIEGTLRAPGAISRVVMFDAEHRPQAKNTAPNNAGDRRATVWELHPVTSFEVLDPQASGVECLTK